jgi:uncharacterized Zn-binding protein involved in type VI secretion
MGQPAVVMGDQVTGMCATHQVPSPAGPPMPSPAPLPFSAPLTTGCEPTVLIGGQPAAVEGSAGFNLPPHVGLHATDPFLVPLMQKGTVVKGSVTVLIGGKGAAYTGCPVSMCFQIPGTVAGSQPTVMIGS